MALLAGPSGAAGKDGGHGSRDSVPLSASKQALEGDRREQKESLAFFARQNFGSSSSLVGFRGGGRREPPGLRCTAEICFNVFSRTEYSLLGAINAQASSSCAVLVCVIVTFPRSVGQAFRIVIQAALAACLIAVVFRYVFRATPCLLKHEHDEPTSRQVTRSTKI